MLGHWSAKTSVLLKIKNTLTLSLCHLQTLKQTHIWLIILSLKTTKAKGALSYLSLNTYQNQLELHNISKQVIFLMVSVIDAWQWATQCSLLNKMINLNYLTVLFISIKAFEDFTFVLVKFIGIFCNLGLEFICWLLKTTNGLWVFITKDKPCPKQHVLKSL